MSIPLTSLDQVGNAAARHIGTTFRDILVGPHAEKTESFIRFTTGEMHPFGNFAVLDDGSNVSAAMDAAQPYQSASFPTALLFVETPSAEVESGLQAVGFQAAGVMPAMAVSIDELAPTALPDRMEFVPVTSSMGRDWTVAFSEGYELPAGVAQWFSPERLATVDEGPEKTSFYAAMDGEKIAGVSALHLADGLAGIYCVATRPEYRGRGIGAHLTAEPLRQCLDLGYRIGVLQASEMGHSVYRRLGFQEVGGVTMFVRMPSD